MSTVDLTLADLLDVNLARRTCLGDVPTRSSSRFAQRVAIVDGDRSLTYGELDDLSSACARGLLEHGIDRGDVVAVLLQNRWEFAVALFGCAKIGAAFMPVNTNLGADEMAFQLRDAAAKLVLTEEVFADAARAAARAAGSPHLVCRMEAPSTAAPSGFESWSTLMAGTAQRVERFVADEDIALILYTSGTTSTPKGVASSHTAVLVSMMATAIQLDYAHGATGPVIPVVLPIFHVAALNIFLLSPLLTGGTVILQRGFDAESMLRCISDFRATHVGLLPFMWGQLVEHAALQDLDLTSLRIAFYAMAPMPARRLEQIRQVFPNAAAVLGSGQTETNPLSEMQWREHQSDKSASWGPGVVTTEVRTMDPDGRVLPAGQEGEIVYRSPQLMSGYLGNDVANGAAFAHGWFHGGDIGYVDDDGVVWFTDRLKDIVKTGGENVSSQEVERILLDHPAVAESAVVGLPHERWNEVVTAFVVLAPGHSLDADELLSHCRARLAAFKLPKEFIVVDELPKTATGKIQKNRLRADYHDIREP
jgi:acyl-CoA synthetase (AMP-forming)/AMP-acid ligase II